MKKLKVNKSACISCGACVSMVSEVFQFGNDDTAEVKVDIIPEDLKEEVMDAVAGCPTGAISYEEETDEKAAE